MYTNYPHRQSETTVISSLRIARISHGKHYSHAKPGLRTHAAYTSFRPHICD